MVSLVFEEGPRAPKPALSKKQLMPHIVDGMARARPQAVYAEYPTNPDSYADGFSKLTYGAFANVINGLAWWIEDNLGPGNDFETLVYFGPNDFRQNALVLAASKAGYKLLLCSPRNTLAGYKVLFDALDVRTVLAAGPPYVPIVDTIMIEYQLRLLPIVSTSELIGTKFPHYPYDKKFISAYNEPLLVLHTSGTTALPKPIIITHDWVSSWAQALHQEVPPGTESLDVLHQGNRVLVMMPPFHAGNLMPTLFDAVHNQSTVIFPLPGGILSPDHFQEHFIGCVRGAHPDIALVPAGFIHAIGKDPELLNIAGKYLEYMFYTGGDVADTYGNALAQRVKLFNVNGSTELASYAALRPGGPWDRTIWKYIMPHPNSGIDWRCHSWDGGDAKYEAVIIRNPDPRDIQPIFSAFPDLHEYHSGDLFSPHPSIPGLWKYRGRADDCFVLVTGSNINPLSMEEHVGAHPEVKGALMLGQRRPRPGLLIELEDEILAEEAMAIEDDNRRLALIEKIWPAIERGNMEYYDLARVTKDRIIFTFPDRPMRRTPKGTVKRRPTLDLYQPEVNKLYGSI
ncbi:acetyl-CoA synthetase-like protein [Penicillium angulare]|uniref:Acetyl-CoA synthetase-like protein n=1 Tax=Penicillium angulare TaxID=116970 RepID=A0A9W9G7W9_9EURO|nr:acetyl-CoA synthetase-like protein [Penicillium angulare]